MQITIRNITRLKDRTYITVGKTQYEIPVATTAGLRAWIRQQINPEMMLLAMLLAIWDQADPTLANGSQLTDKTISVDLTGDLSAQDRILRVS